MLCFFTAKYKAQFYFNNRYDTFGSCDGTNGIDTIYNGYLSAGITCSPSSFYTFLLSQYNYDGTLRKNKVYLRPNENFLPNTRKYIKASNNAFFVSGVRTYQPDTTLTFLWRFNSDLDSVKYYEYGFLNKTNVVSSFINQSKFIYMVGYTDSLATNNDILIIKVDTSGNEIWKKKIGLSGVDESAFSIDTLYNNLIIAGNKNPHGSSSTSGFVMYLDTAANVIWQKTVVTNGGYGGCHAKKLKDGNILIYSRIKKYSIGSDDYYRLQCEKIDQFNNQIWKKEYNAPGNQSEPYSAIENHRGNIVIVGQMGASSNTCNGIVNEIRQNGDSIFSKQYVYQTGCQNYFRDVILAPDSGYCFAGFFNPVFANGCTGNQDIWLLKVDSNFCESTAPCGYPMSIKENGSITDEDVRFYPNPAQDQVIFYFQNSDFPEVKITLLDVLGKVVLEQTNQLNNSEAILNLQNVPNGTYYYIIKQRGSKIVQGKIIVLK